MEISKIQTVRVSKHQMVSMEDCFEKIKVLLDKISKSKENIESRHSINRVCCNDIHSSINIPATKKSTMDGYAVNFNSTNVKKEISIVEKIYAGKTVSEEIHKLENITNKCVYLTTGASVPNWCNAIIPIEYTIKSKNNNCINILEDFKLTEKKFIRDVGSDLKQGDVILNANSIINTSDITMLLSCKIPHICVYKQPIIGLISTGDEIYDLYSKLDKENVLNSDDFMVDSNKEMIRQMLIQSCYIDPKNILDFGNLSDNYDLTEEKIRSIDGKCDILISSGGVSMGEKDLVKLYLENNSDTAEIIFGRLNMKPGKPTTLAKINNMLFFALPGNPVSCFVTFHLLISYAINLFQNQIKFPLKSITAKLQHLYNLDIERPEYARGFIYFNSSELELQVLINGNQQSSRIRSAQNSNCLISLPKGNESKMQIKSDEIVECLLLNLGSNQIGSMDSNGVKELLSHCNIEKTSVVKGEDECRCKIEQDTIETTTSNFKKKTESQSPRKNLKESRIFTVGLLTISDRASKGEYKDESTPKMEEFFGHFKDKYLVKIKRVVPDEKDQISESLIEFSDIEKMDLVSFKNYITIYIMHFWRNRTFRKRRYSRSN